MDTYKYIDARGTIVKIWEEHPIFKIEDSYIWIALKYDKFSEEKPFYIDIDPSSFHSILTYLNCYTESQWGGDTKANSIVDSLQSDMIKQPIIMYYMNKLSILDNTHDLYKTKWNCSLDTRLNLTKLWDEVTGFVYIINMLCENKYNGQFSCITKFGKDFSYNYIYEKDSLPVLDIKIVNMQTNSTVNILLGNQYNTKQTFTIKKIDVQALHNHIEKFSNISDFTCLFNDIQKYMPGCKDISLRVI